MKKIVGYIICSVLLFSACSQPKKTQKRNPFVTEICLKTTPMKDQGRSSLCWLYAMLATIETNHLMQGDSVNLSTDYVARQLLMESARRYYLSRGTTPINMRGMGTRLLTLIQTYGAVPFDAYHAYHPVNYNVVARKLQLASRSTTNFNHLDSRANSILDEAVAICRDRKSTCSAPNIRLWNLPTAYAKRMNIKLSRVSLIILSAVISCSKCPTM